MIYDLASTDPDAPASDVFSLGCTLVYAAAGHTAFGQDSIGAVVRRITAEPPDLAGVPREHGLRQLIGECLAKSPSDRPALDAVLARLTSEDSATEADNTDPGGIRHEETGNLPTDKVPTDDRLVRDHITGSGHSGDKPFDWAERRPQQGEPQSGEAPQSEAQQSEAQSGGGSRRGQISRRPKLIAAGVAVVVLLGTGLGILLSGGGSGKAHHTAAPRTHTARPAHVISPPAQPEATLHDPKGKTVYRLVFSSDSVLASGDKAGAYLWDVPGRKLTATLHDTASGGINDIAFSQNGNSFVTADANGNVFLWNADNHKLIATLRNKSSKGAYSAAISPDGGLVAVGDATGSAYLWNVTAGRFGNAPVAALHDPGGKGVYSVKFSPDGSTLATGDLDGSSYLWNVATGKSIRTFHNTNSAKVYDLAFSPDGRYLAVSDWTKDSSVYLWNISTGELVTTLHFADGEQYAGVTFSPDSRFVAVASSDGGVHVWKVATGKFVASVFTLIDNVLIGVAFSPGGNTLAASDTTGHIYLWPTKWLNS